MRLIKGLRSEPLGWLTASVLAGLCGGIVAWIAGFASGAQLIWAISTAIAIPPLVLALIADARQGRAGLDIIALLALVSALVFHQFLAGALIAVMFATGQALEAFADSRARAELTALLARAPRTADRYRDGSIERVPVDAVAAGDRLLIPAGAVLPVDGVVATTAAVLDESALTGEAIPVVRAIGTEVRSGGVNAGSSFDLVASAPAAASTYAGIVRLVRSAQAEKAPFVRLADRYAAIFLPLTLLVAGVAWVLSGDPVRAVAVLVVATPCPLILAAPVAIVAGISRSAQRGVIVKGGGALETLGRAQIVVLDKTGTLTAGAPVVTEVVPLPGWTPDVVLRLSASLDQASSHVLAGAIVRTAHDRGLSLRAPADVGEEPGMGIRGSVDGHRVAVGRSSWVTPGAADVIPVEDSALVGTTGVYVAIDGRMAGILRLADPLRPDAVGTIQALRRSRVRVIAMLTGDHQAVAARIGDDLGLDAVLARQSPADKIAAVRAYRRTGTVIMVGDGINDAPALAAADVGVAMGARGATASSEAADVVLLVDRLAVLASAMRIARRARGIALQSVLVGMGLSLAAMLVASVGLLPPPVGALLQEGIDVGVILNSLRALRVEDDREPGGPAITQGRTTSGATWLPGSPPPQESTPSARAER
ncbi:MAG TPA: heavy metal translocating P-type ATPase [Candidatus Limnocylindrales bacterium]|nr:heavy metal translocating P-type ATPase [Candidatus Limnocylindrales bacterium]